MLILLTKTLTCIKNNARLVGIMQQNQFDMVVENFEEIPVKCLAFNNTPSKAFLNYEESGVVKSIQTDFQYFADRPLDISFEKIPDAAFDLMATLSIITYTVKLEDKLDVMGTFTSIKNTLVNTSNCWGPMTLNYSRSGDSSLLNISAQPNDCLITDPTVSFQFMVNDVWESIQINPKTSPPAGYNGFKTPFVHMDTLFYEQAYSDMDEANQAKLNAFFAAFQTNRRIPMRLALQFIQPGSTISQQIQSRISNIQSTNTDCLTAIKGYVTLSSKFQILVGGLTNLIGCIPDYETMRINSTALFHDNTLYFNNMLTAISGMSGFLFSFPVSQEDKLSLSEIPNTYIYITMIDQDGNVVREEALEYKTIGSCFTNIKSLVSYKETCLILFPIFNDRCASLYETAVSTKFQQVLQGNASSLSRIAYQVFQFDLKIQSGQFQKICLNQNQNSIETEYPIYDGNFKTRQKVYVKNMAKVFQPLSLVSSKLEQQFEYSSAVDEKSVILVPLLLSFVFVLIIVIIGISFMTLKMIQ